MDSGNPEEKEFAVILNENARRVTGKIKNTAQDIAPRIALYTSKTKEEAYQILKDLMDRGVQRIISGGGDGTFFHLVSLAKRYMEEQNGKLQKVGRYAREEISRLSLPEFGILKLGTGNSFAPLLGIKKGLQPVRMLAEGKDFDTKQIHLLETEQQCFTFCGMGLDAQILNDYMWLKKHVRRKAFSWYVQSLFGYFTAIAFRTIPKVLLSRKKTNVTLRNLGDRLYRVRPDGCLENLNCPNGEIFYHGPCSIAGVATTPYYGYGLKAFPYALANPGLMHVRIIKAGVTELVANAWPIWNGTYQSPRFLEFLAEKVHFSFSDDMPLQLGGDAEGYRKEISIQVSDLTVNLLDFNRPLLPA